MAAATATSTTTGSLHPNIDKSRNKHHQISSKSNNVNTHFQSQSQSHQIPLLSDFVKFTDHIHYSPRYADDIYEYRHVILPKNMLKALPKWYFRDPSRAPHGVLRLLTEYEWRSVGITQSLGWVHYDVHEPEPHILLFRREKDYQEKYPEAKPQDIVPELADDNDESEEKEEYYESMIDTQDIDLDEDECEGSEDISENEDENQVNERYPSVTYKEMLPKGTKWKN